MSALISFSSAQVGYDNSLPFDDSREQSRYEAACELIESDPARLFEAVLDDGSDGDDVSLAELRIVLSRAAPAINMLTHGDSLDVAMNHPARAQAMRDLFRAVQAAERLVNERLKAAADDLL